MGPDGDRCVSGCSIPACRCQVQHLLLLLCASHALSEGDAVQGRRSWRGRESTSAVSSEPDASRNEEESLRSSAQRWEDVHWGGRLEASEAWEEAAGVLDDLVLQDVEPLQEQRKIHLPALDFCHTVAEEEWGVSEEDGVWLKAVAAGVSDGLTDQSAGWCWRFVRNLKSSLSRTGWASSFQSPWWPVWPWRRAFSSRS